MPIFEKTNIDENIRVNLEKAGLFSYKAIIELTLFELRKITNLTSEECQTVQELASKLYLKSSILPVLQLSDEKRITMDCPVLNQLLGGGISLRGITELYGESGAGKTQICLQLTLTVQYPKLYGGMEAGAVFICTEDKFPTNRLNQMFKHFPRDPELKEKMKDILLGDRIYIDHVADIDGLKECIFYRLPKLLSNNAVGIIIIDSIAAIYRNEYTFRQTVERAKIIREIALQLHRINKKFNIAILCINQVSDSMESTNEKIPALGLVWANMVTSRLQAFRYPKRALKVVHAPDLPNNFSYYKITEEGVFGSDSPND